MKRLELSLLIGITLAVLFTSFASFGVQADEVRQEVVRLHVLANSDSEEDQALKLAVRDVLLIHTEELFASATSREEAEQAAYNSLREMEEVARQEIERQGYHYSVTAKLVNMYFETRQYGDITLPAGRYDAVRVEIGSGQGQNWWCVMFPPMCVPAASEQSELPLEEQIRELSAGQPQYTPKFAVVELIESVHNRITGGEDEAAAIIPLQLDDDCAEQSVPTK